MDRGTLIALAHALTQDETMEDADLARIAAAADREHARIVSERSWAATAHVCEVPHAPVITTEAFDEGGRSGEREVVDASGVVCHDCGRALVSDVGTEPVLVCPSLHGRRPRELAVGPGQAVECGRPAT